MEGEGMTKIDATLPPRSLSFLFFSSITSVLTVKWICTFFVYRKVLVLVRD